MDLRRADLALLISLDALLAERSVTRASERLGVSQPALSAQLARLRELLGDPLLVPSGRKLVLTTRAEDLREPLHRIIDELQTLVRERKEFIPGSTERTFRIAATDYVHRVFTLELASSIAATAPGVRIAMLAFDARRGWDALEDNEVDLIVTSDRLTPTKSVARKLFDERFVMVQRKGHPRGIGPIDLDRFCSLSHVLVSPQGGGFFGATDETLDTMGKRRHVAVSIPSFLLAPALITRSDLIAVIPERLADAFDDILDKFEPPIPIPGFPIIASWHPRCHNDPGHQWIRGSAAELAQ